MLVRENGAWIFKPRTSEWHQTQDRVELADGMLTPLGRADTLVKVLGELVDPEGIERELAAFQTGSSRPARSSIVAVPDARAEHALVPVFDAEADADVIAAALTAYADAGSRLPQAAACRDA